jgi:hypothetical protein
MKYEQQNNASSSLCWHPRWYVMTKWNRNKDNVHRAWCPFKTWVVMKYWKFLWSEYTMISCWTPSSKWRHSSKASMMVKSSLSWILYLIFEWENLQEWKPTRWRRLSSPSYESMMPITKSEASIFKTKGLEGFAWQSWKKPSKIERNY